MATSIKNRSKFATKFLYAEVNSPRKPGKDIVSDYGSKVVMSKT